ncbi:Gfo/Idh/MocA family oxidoreductase [Thioclava sp. GXIMD2076]|uniref:Gfo/Idh/MocA family protein n=1 Tax=Thioclava sp. GXIMD2076 TaxID=3131931 RepID=UPI0030CF09D8
MTRLACFGAGRIGQIHALNAARLPDVSLVAIADPIDSPARAQLCAATGAQLRATQDIFDDPDIDGVIIASSTDSHVDLLRLAAQTGKAVFCEKPISLDFALSEQVTQAVEASGIRCMMGFQRRYDASFRALRERIASGEAGRLEQLSMWSRDPAPPPRAYVERSGGMFRDSSIHDADMVRYMMDEEIATVYAVGACLISEEIGAAGDVDSLMITMTTVSGRQAQITGCRRGPMGFDQRLEALCSHEVLSIANQPQHHMVVSTRSGALSAPPEAYFLERFAQAYRDEMVDFVAMIRDGHVPLAGIRDGFEAQRLVEAAIRSMCEGRAVDLRQPQLEEV